MPDKITFDNLRKRYTARKPVFRWLLGIIILLLIVGYSGYQYIKANSTGYYSVYYNDKYVGDVLTKESVNEIVKRKVDEQQLLHPELTMGVGELKFKKRSAYNNKVHAVKTLNILDAKLVVGAKLAQIKVKNKVIGYLADRGVANELLQKIKFKYTPINKKADSVVLDEGVYVPQEISRSISYVGFVEKVTIEDVYVQPEKLMTPEDVSKKLIEGSSKPTKYTVQEGDCIGCIADKFRLSEQFIYEKNPNISEEKLRPGDVLDLSVVTPEVTIRTEEQVVEQEDIEPKIKFQKDAKMRAGESKVISEGKVGKKLVTYLQTKHNGYLMKEKMLVQKVIKAPQPTVIIKGTKVIPGEGTGNFAWPVRGAKLSSRYGYRWGRLHAGIDITGSKTIMAADHGIVVFTGQKTGYGNCIIIDHRNGYKTLYGHLKSIGVHEGQRVEKGQSIGIMGNTGRSYGTHLHFEIHKDDNTRNPLNYL